MRDRAEFPDTAPAQEWRDPRPQRNRRPDDAKRGYKVAREWIYAVVLIAAGAALMALVRLWSQ